MRKNKLAFLLITAFSVTMATVGFFLDTDVRESSLALNLFEISMMAVIIFVLTFGAYSLIRFTRLKMAR